MEILTLILMMTITVFLLEFCANVTDVRYWSKNPRTNGV